MGLQNPFSGVDPVSSALRACRVHFAAAAAFSAFVNILYLAPTVYMLQIYDRVLPASSKVTLGLLTFVLVIGLATLAILDWLRGRILIRCSAQLDSKLASEIMVQTLRQAHLSRVDRMRYVREFDVFRQVISGAGTLAAFDAPWVPIYILAAFMLHPALGSLCCLASAAMLGLARLNERVGRAGLATANGFAATAYASQDYASSVSEEVRALGMVETLVTKQVSDRQKMLSTQTEASFSTGSIVAFIRFLRLFLQSAALGLAALLALDGHMSPGAVMGGSFLLMRCLSPIDQIVGAWKGIANALEAYASLTNLFSKASRTERTILPRPNGGLQVENLTVYSPQGNSLALANVSLAVEPGKLIVVVGPSGSGKSSLLRVLAGATAPSGGTVRLDGASIADWDPDQYSNHIGYLPQEFSLFPGTIKDNITRFRTYAGEEARVIDAMAVSAAVLAGAHEMILRLQDGYETLIGLGGKGMSGGQMQRIALARALFGDPSVVILDEPDSHLDHEGERSLAAAIESLKAKGVTVIAAVHRGGIGAIADKMLLLNKGQVQAFGALADLNLAMRAANAQQPHVEQRRA